MSLKELDKITVEVTAADIAAGRPLDSELCPIALALRRTFPRVRNIAVGKPDVCLGQYEWKMDASSARFVDAFDEGRPTKPRQITLVKEG